MTDIVPTPTSEIAAQFQRSGLFPDLQSEAQAYVKILAGQELGIGPMAAVAGLNVIKGKITFSANLLASMVKRHPRYDYRVTKHEPNGCRIVFLQDGDEIGVSEFTADDAKRANLGGTNWQRYPKAMMFARALTQGVRWYCPDVTSGTPAYVPEELEESSGHPETVDPRVRGDITVEVVEPVNPLERLGQLVNEYEFDDEQRLALRDFIRSGGDEAIESAVALLEEGNTAALFAGIEFEAVEAER